MGIESLGGKLICGGGSGVPATVKRGAALSATILYYTILYYTIFKARACVCVFGGWVRDTRGIWTSREGGVA